MRYKTLIILLMASCFALNCEESPVTGSEDVVELQNMSVQVDTTYAFGDQFVAEGTIRNNNSSTVTPRWFLEMSVFRDAAADFKFGGSNTSFNFSLSANQATGWRIEFSNPQYPASEYPNFTVGEFRAYKLDDHSDD